MERMAFIADAVCLTKVSCSQQYHAASAVPLRTMRAGNLLPSVEKMKSVTGDKFISVILVINHGYETVHNC